MDNMEQCPICGGSEFDVYEEDHNLAVMGLPRVTVIGINVYTCRNCGESFRDYPMTRSFKELVVKSLVAVKRNLTGNELAYIRKALGYTAKKWASLIGVHNVTVSDWENEKAKPNKTAEMALRMKASLDFEIDPHVIGSNDGEPVVEMSALPIVASMPLVSNWSNTNKRVVNGR